MGRRGAGITQENTVRKPLGDRRVPPDTSWHMHHGE